MIYFAIATPPEGQDHHLIGTCEKQTEQTQTRIPAVTSDNETARDDQRDPAASSTPSNSTCPSKHTHRQ